MYNKYLLVMASGLCFCLTNVEAFAEQASSFQSTRISRISNSNSLSSSHFPLSIHSQKITQASRSDRPSSDSTTSTPQPRSSPTPTPLPTSSPVTDVTLDNKDARDYDIKIVSANSDPIFINIGKQSSRSNVCSSSCKIFLGELSVNASGNDKVIIVDGKLIKQTKQ